MTIEKSKTTMKCHSKLVLGTVQLGLRYGIRHRDYKPPSSLEVEKILAVANSRGVASLDTAFEYGDSELLIGEFRPSSWHPRIITKTPKLRGGNMFKSSGSLLSSAYDISCQNLKVDRCDVLMVHDPENLFQPGGEHLIEALHEIAESGRVGKIGISIYDRSQIDRAFELFPFAVLQAPVSLADQRLLTDGTLRDLKQRGVEIHARSLFLQGALLMGLEEIPPGLMELAPAVIELIRRSAEVEISPMQALLGFAIARQEIDAVVVGVNLASQLVEVCDYSMRRLPEDFDRSVLPIGNQTLLDPGTWAGRINI